MNKTFLNTEFDSFKKSAESGYKIAKKQHEKLEETIKNAKSQIVEVLNDFYKSRYMDSTATKSLGVQLDQIYNSFNDLEIKTKEDILSLKKNLSMFSITLFGRTMAGKSTLMEFLTHGAGDTIGKGEQRTTRDVRTYKWNNLSITDVPGIGAFGGEEDETIAFDAAKNGDVILFLITDDAPQDNEAECLSKIVNLGKPIIIILNVKATISANENIKLAIRDIEKKFTKEHVDNIKKQFREFAQKFGQQWNHIPIVPVHLQAAYLSQKTENKDVQSQLYKISRIDFLQDVIVKSVKENGNFYRIKNFVDIIDNPMISSMEILLEQSNKNSTQARLILGKKRKLESWQIKFKNESENKIRSFLATVKSDLYSEVASFAENHYEDKNAGNAWKQIIINYNIEEKATSVLKEIENRCIDYLSEISREIEKELEYSNHIVADKSLNMELIIDGKRIWNWGVILTSGGLTIAAVITGLCGLACAGPLGWAALIVGSVGALLSFLFTDKNKKINEARQRLEAKLKSNIDSICKKIEETLNKCLDEIIEKRIVLLCKEIQRILNVMFSLSDEQRKLAWSINHRILELNREIFTSALKLTGFDGLQYHIKEVARIPGKAILLELPDGTRFPVDSKEKIFKLMREEVFFVFESEDKWILLARILGKIVDRKNIKIEDKIGIAHIPIDKNNLFLVCRVQLAQQLTELLITR